MDLKNTPYGKPAYLERLYWRKQVKKGELPIIDTICIWTDICGFGNELANAGMNLQDFINNGMHEALELLHDKFTSPGHFIYEKNPTPKEKDTYDRAIIINDGVAKVIDVLDGNIYSHSISRYLADIIIRHWQVLNCLHERYNGKLGLRTVISSGQRMQYTNEQRLGSEFVFHGDEISDVDNDFMATTFCSIPKQLQMNTAFARSYLIESSGSKNGIERNGFYIDESVLKLLTNKLKKSELSISHKSILFRDRKLDALELDKIKDIKFKHNLFETMVYRIGKAKIGFGLESEEVSFDVSDIGVDPFDVQTAF